MYNNWQIRVLLKLYNCVYKRLLKYLIYWIEFIIRNLYALVADLI